MGKTADLTVVQKTIIDILHKDAKEAGCLQSAVSKQKKLFFILKLLKIHNKVS